MGLEMRKCSWLPGPALDAIPILIKERQEKMFHCYHEYKEGCEKTEAEMRGILLSPQQHHGMLAATIRGTWQGILLLVLSEL